MIKPTKPAGINHVLSVYDIETGSEGELLDIGFVHDGDYQTFKTWLSFVQHLVTVETEQTGNAPIRVIWAHNGGGFDNVALVCELYRNDKVYRQLLKSYTARLINGSILELELTLHNDESIKFRDSYRLFPMSLAKLLDAFKLAPKHTSADEYKSRMEVFKKERPVEYYAYLKQDVIGLSQALEKFRTLVNDISPIGDLSLSLGSLALKVYKTSFLDAPIETPSADVQKFTNDCYAGGRTEFFGNGQQTNGIYEHCNYYDVNSMYPAIMQAGLFPFGKAILTNKLRYNDNNELIPGVYLIDYEQTGGHIPLLRDQSTGKKSKEHCWKGSGTYTAHEIEYLKNIGANVKIKRGFFYPDSKPLFKDFVDTLYSIRLKAREEGNAALDLTAKLIQNNLYGKFAQREEGEELQFLTMEQVREILNSIRNGSETEIISIAFMEAGNALIDVDQCDENGVYAVSVKKRVKVHHRHVLIAATITAKARIQITDIAERYHDKAIYCDTDSFITQAQLAPALICDKTLGMFKAEHLDVAMEFYGRKQYRFVESGKVKQKGVAIDDPLAFAAAVKTEQGYEAEYRTPSSIKTAVKKGIKNANKFERKIRTIKADKSSAEKCLLK